LIFEGENHVQHTETFLLPILSFYKATVRASPPVKNSPEDFENKTMKLSYPSHICMTSNGQLCISYAGSNQLIFCEVDGKVIVNEKIFVFERKIDLSSLVGRCWQRSIGFSRWRNSTS